MKQPQTLSNAAAIAGVVLAGGRATRMGGGDKSLTMLAGRPILGRVISRLKPQVATMVLSANGDPARFSAFALPVEADPLPDRPGPLAGVLAGMEWAARQRAPFTHIVSVAADTPFFPADLVDRLVAALTSGSGLIALARSDGRTHPVFGLWPIGLHDDLRAFLDAGETYKVRVFAERHGVVFADFPLEAGIDPFFNINTPEDFASAEAICGKPGE